MRLVSLDISLRYALDDPEPWPGEGWHLDPNGRTRSPDGGWEHHFVNSGAFLPTCIFCGQQFSMHDLVDHFSEQHGAVVPPARLELIRGGRL